MSKNRLGAESSPYLLQHKDNPVDWWPWGPDALAEARTKNKPILLSIGYAACHWCHVMAHESFEDPATAAVMNELYVSIKVDREERPDIDAIYMAALHHMGEQGGWPLTMFLTPEAEPFWGGTYFPKEERFGRPSFTRVLREIARIHRDEPDRIASTSRALMQRLRAQRQPGENVSASSFSEAIVREAAMVMARVIDVEHGGMGGAPKFPTFSFFWLQWRAGIRYGLEASQLGVLTTLHNVCQGGIYDHIGGGFARYSVDERWLVPHFEKMLYDNALLVELLTDAWRETRDPLFANRIRETVDWLRREMITSAGAFASSYDADSEGEEGKFYVWTPEQVKKVLGEAAGEEFCRHYDITPGGNFEGHSIANRLGKPACEAADTEDRLREMRATLLAARAERIPPGWDDKVLADWNGLMIRALVHAGRAFGDDYIEMAKTAYAAIHEKMTRDGRLMHAMRNGLVRGPATAADYANMIAAAVALHCQAPRQDDHGYLADARHWAGIMQRHYWLADAGGYAFTADDTDDVIVRMRTAHDDATPNANGTMITNLVQLFLLTGEQSYQEQANATLVAFLPELAQSAIAHTGILNGAMDLLAPQHVVIIGREDVVPLTETLAALAMPGALEQVVATASRVPPSSPLAGKTAIGGKATGYVCVGPQCSKPATDAAGFRTTLLAARSIDVTRSST